MAGNTFGQLYTVTTYGESHGPALGCIVDGCPPGLELTEADIQRDVVRRRSGTSRYTSQRKEPDTVRILSGVFEGRTTGTPIGLLVENADQRSYDYDKIKDRFRPGHADYTYQQKYGIRDYRGGGFYRQNASIAHGRQRSIRGERCRRSVRWLSGDCDLREEQQQHRDEQYLPQMHRLPCLPDLIWGLRNYSDRIQPSHSGI